MPEHVLSWRLLLLRITPPKAYSPTVLKIYLFLYFCLHWVSLASHGLSLVLVSGLLIAVASLRRAGFSSCGAWA